MVHNTKGFETAPEVSLYMSSHFSISLNRSSHLRIMFIGLETFTKPATWGLGPKKTLHYIIGLIKKTFMLHFFQVLSMICQFCVFRNMFYMVSRDLKPRVRKEYYVYEVNIFTCTYNLRKTCKNISN